MDAILQMQELLKTELAKHPELTCELASHFQVADSTVRRWEAGTARPHALIAQQIINFVNDKQKTG